MARKSKRGQGQVNLDQAGLLSIQAVMPVVQQRTAAYARLSVEKENEETLQTQVIFLHQFIEGRDDLVLTETYMDNGFSGTNFDRPDFTRLMNDVYSGKIQCIVVKDLSRFGRNLIETGNYIENIFPKLNVRLIAVTDRFDSSREEDRNSIAVPIRNMINAMYAKEWVIIWNRFFPVSVFG